MPCTNLTNAPAPQNSALITVTPRAFIRWMNEYGAVRIDNGNTKQVVAILYERAKVVKDGISFTPNWHLTAMTDRMSSVVNNFHFKIEATKAFAHYWHYVLYHHPVGGTFHFVGDVGDIPGRNDAGGGAAGDVDKLDANLALVTLSSAVYKLDNGVTKNTQKNMQNKLKQMVDSGLAVVNNGTLS